MPPADPFCKSFGCLSGRWRNGQIHELPFLPAFSANKTVISFKQFILGIGTFINSALIFSCFFWYRCKKNYMGDIGIIEESSPYVRVVHGLRDKNEESSATWLVWLGNVFKMSCRTLCWLSDSRIWIDGKIVFTVRNTIDSGNTMND